jgi:probable HAF family extracellular repeat protein
MRCRWGQGIVGLLVLGMSLVFVPAAPGGAATGRLVVTTTRLPLLEPSGPEAYGQAVAINDRGEIVGSSGRWPTLWRRGRVVPLTAEMPAFGGWGAVINARCEVIVHRAGLPLSRWFRGRLTELDLGPGSQRWSLVAFNDRGQALIESGGSPGVATGLWEPDGSFTPLVPPEGYLAFPADLSDAGHVAGYLTPIDAAGQPGYRPYVWKDGRLTVLGDLGVARAVNRRGQVAGIVPDSDHPLGVAVVWDHGEETRLVPDTFPASFAADINERGQVIGRLGDGPNQAQGFLWDDGELTEIPAPDAPIVSPERVNERGQVVGTYTPGGSEFHAFVWDRGEMADLGPSYGIHAINDRGQAVGSVRGAAGAQPVLWEIAHR